eukprot:scaffold5828_cov168-Amphora_coffeaeformis.AAC.18
MMYAHPTEVEGDGGLRNTTTTTTTTGFHWFKINYLILLIAGGFLLHVNFFQAYTEEPYMGSNMNTATTSSHGRSKQHHTPSTSRKNQTQTVPSNAFKPAETATTVANITTKSTIPKSSGEDDRVHDDSSPSFLGGMDPTKVKLSDLIDTHTYKLKVNVTDMIDFATIGNPKTGTSFMSQWFRRHSELLTPKPEMRAMQWPGTGPGKTVEIMFPLLKEKTPQNKLGYKCPADVREFASLRNLRDYFPKAKLIVGIRHPVLWFESFHNYRIRRGTRIPPAMQCRGKCHKEHDSVCTYSGYFHLFLAQMGFTSLSTREETDLLRHYDVNTLEPLPFNLKSLQPAMPHDVFLYETTQIDGSKVPHIAEAFRQDLSHYLELKTPLASLASAKPVAHSPDETKLVGEIIDICDPQYKLLREELVLIGRDAAQWILEFFVPLPQVHVSSPEFFRQVLEGYGSDPCDNKTP